MSRKLHWKKSILESIFNEIGIKCSSLVLKIDNIARCIFTTHPVSLQSWNYIQIPGRITLPNIAYIWTSLHCCMITLPLITYVFQNTIQYIKGAQLASRIKKIWIIIKHIDNHVSIHSNFDEICGLIWYIIKNIYAKYNYNKI